MGIWAVGSLENDTALNWLGELHRSQDIGVIRGALSTEDAQRFFRCALELRAVAAAEVVACWLGHPPPEPRRAGLVDWAREHLAITPEIVSAARVAVAAIKADSSLKESWTDQHGVVRPEWLASVEDLESRLAGDLPVREHNLIGPMLHSTRGAHSVAY